MDYDLKLWHKLIINVLVLGPLTILHVMPDSTIGPVTFSNGGIPWLVPAGLSVAIAAYDIAVHWGRRKSSRAEL